MKASILSGKKILAVDDEPDVLKYEYLTGWNTLFKKLRGFFSGIWGKDWQKTDPSFWKEFNTKLLNA